MNNTNAVGKVVEPELTASAADHRLRPAASEPATTEAR
jgi:hypothetical protein